jgi:hypothetical protein
MVSTVTEKPTRRANFLATLRNGAPAWIPLIGHVDSYNRPGDTGLPRSIADAAAEHGWWSGHAGIEYARFLDITIAAWTAPPLTLSQAVCEKETHEEGGDTINVIHTPFGDLREVNRQAANGAASYRIEHYLKTPDDLPKLASVFEGERVSLDVTKQQEVGLRAREVGEDGILISPMPGTPLGMLIRIYAGPETTTYLHADAPESLNDLFIAMERSYSEQLALASSTPIDAFLGMDDTSTNTESPSMFRDHCLEYTNRVSEIIHANESMYWHHSCGLIHDLLPIYRESRMDAVHAFTEPPTGDVQLDEGRSLLGDQIGIVAGLRLMEHPLVDLEYAAKEIRELFERVGSGTGFCLCLAAFQHLTMKQISWLREECRKYQVPSQADSGAPIARL